MRLRSGGIGEVVTPTFWAGECRSPKTAGSKTIVYSRSVDPRKLCLGVKYYIVLYTYYLIIICTLCHTTLMVYSTAYSAYISKERRCNKDQRGVGNKKIEKII